MDAYSGREVGKAIEAASFVTELGHDRPVDKRRLEWIRNLDVLVFVLMFGSANVLFIAVTIMVPIGNLAFALPFVP